MASCSWLVSFPFNVKDSFYHFFYCMSNFYFSWKSFISPSFLKDSFVKYGILGQHFFFRPLNISFHWLLDCKTSDKSSENLRDMPPFMWQIAFPLLLSRFSVWFWLLTVWLCVLVWVSFSLSWLEFVELTEFLCAFLSSSLGHSCALLPQTNPVLLLHSLLLLGLPYWMYQSSWWFQICSLGSFTVLHSVFFFFLASDLILSNLSSSWLILSSD